MCAFDARLVLCQVGQSGRRAAAFIGTSESSKQPFVACGLHVRFVSTGKAPLPMGAIRK